MAAHSDCEQHTNKGIPNPDLPPSPSSTTTHPDSEPRGQKRKRICAGSAGSAGHQARKRGKKNELNTSTVACTGNQSDAQEQETRLITIPDCNNPETRDGISSEASKNNGTPTNPIQYWAHNQRWPEDFANMSQEQSASSKRRASSSSYTQRHKDGEVPEAYSAAYEKHLVEYGMVMEESAGRAHVSKGSELLCNVLLLGIAQEPQNTMFPISKFLSAWERAQPRNEARVFRDITPLLVPSPELLFVSGHDELQHLVEEIDVEWIKCKTLGGPRPKPDFAVGLASSAFSEEEITKLRNYTSSARPTAFTENLYFPFLLCEVKCSDQGIRRADRQNMHSSSIAVDAIQKLGNVVDGEILVYSISHDNERVKLYGHFVDNGTFYRYPIQSFALNFNGNYGWKETHDFVREVYRLVYPAHLKRIQTALAAMEDPQKVSMTSSMSFEGTEEGTEEAGSQTLDSSVHSSQVDAIFKKPGTPASKKQKNEMALLREQFAEQQRQNKEQMLLLERQMAEQADQYKEQIKLLNQLLQRR